MKVHTAEAKHPYGNNELPDGVDPEEQIPVAIDFEPEELQSDFLITPMDQLFFDTMELLDLPFQRARLRLNRPGMITMTAPNISIKAYEGESWYDDPEPRVMYRRFLKKGLDMGFHELERGNLTIEDIVARAKRHPGQGDLEVHVEGLKMRLIFDYDLSRISGRNPPPGEEYKDKGELTVAPDLEWLSPHMRKTEMVQKGYVKDMTKACEQFSKILTSYLER